MRDLLCVPLAPPKGLTLLHFLSHHSIREGALSCVFHYLVTTGGVLPMRPLTKRTVHQGRRYAGVLVGTVGVPKEEALTKVQQYQLSLPC